MESRVATEKIYPIRALWLFKRHLFEDLFALIISAGIIALMMTTFQGASLFSPTILALSFFIILLNVVCWIPVMIRVVQRANFHYAFEERFIALTQGILMKKNRNIPYGRVQEVYVNQDLFDRLFGLASITFEDYSDGGTSAMNSDGYIGTGKHHHEVLGFVGNKIHIPGLKHTDAEAIKKIILQKVESSSGGQVEADPKS